MWCFVYAGECAAVVVGRVCSCVVWLSFAWLVLLLVLWSEGDRRDEAGSVFMCSYCLSCRAGILLL